MAADQLPVLILEADDNSRERIVEAVYRAGYEVHGAHDADDGLGVLSSHRRRWLVVANVDRLPLDGWAFLDALALFRVPEDHFRVLIVSENPRAQQLRTRPFVHGVVSRRDDLSTLLSTVGELAAVTRRAV